MSKNETAASPFFANAVHELRTPIQTIIGTLELMGDTSLNPEQTEYVRQVKFSADILLANHKGADKYPKRQPVIAYALEKPFMVMVKSAIFSFRDAMLICLMLLS